MICENSGNKKNVTKKNEIQKISSIIGYLIEILSLQYLHFHHKKTQEKNGTKSSADNLCQQVVHSDLSETKVLLFFTLQITAFVKLQIIKPKNEKNKVIIYFLFIRKF